jgi:hypothetical protein
MQWIFWIFILVVPRVFMALMFVPTMIYFVYFPYIARLAAESGKLIWIGLYTALPIIAYGTSYVIYKGRRTNFEAKVNRLNARTANCSLPTFLVSEGCSPRDISDGVCVKDVLFLRSYGSGQIIGVEGRISDGLWIKGATIEDIPNRHLSLRISGRSTYSRMAGKGQRWEPYELSLVENGKWSLIALHYPYPIDPPLPLLTFEGWARKNRFSQGQITSDQIEQNIRSFLRKSLGNCG